MLLSKTFSMPEMDFYQNLRLKHYKKLKELWTDEIDGDCFIVLTCIETQKIIQ